MDSDTIQIPRKILEEVKRIREDLDYIKKVISESEIGDLFLTKEEEELIEETLEQKKKGELLTFEEVFSE
ncbi:MAG TPA: hypothetical protein ENI32_03705 [Candidatus Syntrophoarchaeum butanivorans]|uniref:Uncharacterized protein n=1 Tax=Candidatus Syntropharchaeum butanivorans TaxID=1839936 RepID=A0A7J2S119_9EURY|nr:hypothetical protein [Candidatus Syntrophoarchaeum butanivorans]